MDRLINNALLIFRSALRAGAPDKAIQSQIKWNGETLVSGSLRFKLLEPSQIFVVGAGKASARMALALEKILGSRIQKGWINVPSGTRIHLKRIKLFETAHPIPDSILSAVII